MSYYGAAYLVFWTALFAYLVGLTRRQARLVARAEGLVARLATRPDRATNAADDGATTGGGA